MDRFDWNDIRHFLAVAEHGSTMAASKALKVSQATVSRRVAFLENELGSELFTRSPSGYALTERGKALLPAAREIESAVRRFEGQAGAAQRQLSGKVLVTTVDSAAQLWVIPALATLRERHPGIAVELVATDQNLDLVHGEADVALRFNTRPTESSLVVRDLASLKEGIYASADLVERYGIPESLEDLARYPFLAATYEPSSFREWIEQHIPGAKVSQSVNTLAAKLTGIRAGLGAGVVPSLMGDESRSMVRLWGPIEELSTPCFLVTTDAARRQPHVRAVIDTLVDHVLEVVRKAEAR